MSPHGPGARAAFAAAGVLLVWPLASPRADQTAPVAMPAPAPREAAARHVDRGALMATVRRLSAPEFGGRRTGTPGALAARRYIVGKLTDAGLEPAFSDGFVQRFRVRGVEGGNVAGLVRGTERSDRALIVSAHYDHLGVRNGTLYPGADDNASGVAVLLAAAGRFAEDRPRHSMIFAAFDAEEAGLAGAKTFLRAPPVPTNRIVINVNLDMLARSDRREIGAAGPFHTPCLLPLLQDVQRRASVRIVPGYDRPGAGRRDDWTMLSDHAVFHRAGVPFLYFGVEDHADYHGPGDTPARIDPAFFGDVADAILETLRTLDAERPGPPCPPPPPERREPFSASELSTGA